jgi:hypothetical protein
MTTFVEEKKWFGVEGVGQLLRMQKPVTPTVRTMAAAYKQHDDVAALLTLLAGVKLDKEEKAVLADVRRRHEVYAAQM